MQKIGFKAFNKDMKNQYGIQFEEGRVYKIPEDIVLTKGPTGTGFHYTPYLEDTLRYVNGMIEEIKIARVIAKKEIITFDDEYNGYYDISSTREIVIDHVLTREEIMTYMLNRSSMSMQRFIKGYKLTEQELNIIKEKYKNDISVNLAISYYQEQDKQAYVKFYKR